MCGIVLHLHPHRRINRRAHRLGVREHAFGRQMHVADLVAGICQPVEAGGVGAQVGHLGLRQCGVYGRSNGRAYGPPFSFALAGLLLGARSLPRQLIGVPRQCRHIVRVDPALPLHAACSKLAGLAVGLALGCCLGGGQKRTVRNTSKPRVVLRT